MRFQPLTTALAVGVSAHLAQAAGLHDAAVAKGLLYFGTATDNPELTDTSYVTQLNNTGDFGQITPGNTQKWDSTEPSQNEFSFTKGDVVADLADANDQKLRCHNLVWHQQLPNWVSSGSWTNETLTAVLQNHITNVVKHYKGRCYAWDVVNEALADDGSYRDSIWYKTIGEAYIPIAFAAAAAADPDVKLYYNDYSIEWGGSKSTGAQNIVKLIQSYGGKIDGVGLQAHFTVGQTPARKDLASNLKSFTDLGVEVAYTEVDVRMQTPATEANLQQQSTEFANIVGACLDTKGCVGVTIWDWTDKYSWVPSTFPGYGAACPWDENFEKKPAYQGILEVLGGEASASTSTSVSASASAAPETTSALLSSTAAAVTPTSFSTSISTPPAASTTSSSSPSTTPVTSSSTSSSSTTPTDVIPQPSSTVTSRVKVYYQCGGINYQGSTECEEGLTCKKWNPYYSQCLQV
ncbi:glycoside hydrolase superfamily [Aspergillus pseudonomiae]|uniref:Beta-xylanase n=1 Tax=Aspergillus pseudonomiae TaxID=1506151 RepID=A0A5N7DGL8_9EURO|nr:glycoside hydrolase superfamily [Aspergillus pseudonomiae]KAE8405561.1 glycoside hydrolase superfamily [Aspergillus pseudonomiae]